MHLSHSRWKYVCHGSEDINLLRIILFSW